MSDLRLTDDKSNSTEQISCCETEEFSRYSRISAKFWKPQIYYRVYNIPPHAPNLTKKNPIHIIGSCFFKTHFDVILPCMSRSLKWSLCVKYPHQNFTRIFFSFAFASCRLSSYHPSSDHMNNICQQTRVIKVYIVYFSLFSFSFLILRPIYLSQYLVYRHPWPMLFPSLIWEPKLHTHIEYRVKLCDKNLERPR